MQSYLEFLAIYINFGAIFDNSPLNSDLAQQYQINKIRNKLLIAFEAGSFTSNHVNVVNK